MKFSCILWQLFGIHIFALCYGIDDWKICCFYSSYLYLCFSLLIIILLTITLYVDTSLLQVKARIDRHDSFQKTDISNTMSIKIKKTSTTSEALPESGKNSPSIAENTRASQKKETLYSSLLEISSYALLLMRTLGSRKGRSSDEHNTRFQIEHEEDFAVNNDILQSLSYCLNMLNNGNVEILHVARDVQKYLEMLKCRMKEDIAKNVLEECLDKINILSSKIKRKKMVNRRAEVNCIFK